MKNFRNKTIFINAIISFIAIILSSFLTYYFTKEREAKRNTHISNKEAMEVTLENTLKYSDYSTIDWKEIEGLYYRPYNCDWDYNNENLKDIDVSKIIDEKYGLNEMSPVFCDCYHKLQNAKTDFRRQTTKARIIGSQPMNGAIKDIECGFDEVFLKIVNDYYLRAFVEHYNGTMKDKFDNLEKVIAEELKEY